MDIYHNGILVGQTASASDAMEGTLAGDSILSMARFDAGTTPTVKVDDLRIYGYALSQAEIADLAGGPVVQPIEPIYTEYDLNDDGSIKSNDAILIMRVASGLAAPARRSPGGRPPNRTSGPKGWVRVGGDHVKNG